MSYSINEVAKMMGVNASAIRYYDEVGILPNIKRVNGKRVFEDEDFKWLMVLNCMKKINMPISKIKEYVDLALNGDDTLEERYKLIKEQKKNILSEIDALQIGGRVYTTELLSDKILVEIASNHDVTVAQVILRWNLQSGVVVNLGSSNPEHIKGNTDIYGFELTEDEMELIESLNRDEKHDWY